MRLVRLDIRRADGLERGFVLKDLSPGVNLLVGPNGSGKSTVREIVAASLWPAAAGGRVIEADAVFGGADSTWHARLRGGRAAWQRSGEEDRGPVLPAKHLAPCYSLGVGDLLEPGDGPDRELARAVVVQMAGGYDLVALRTELSIGRRTGTSEAAALGRCSDEHRRICGEHQVLGVKEESLEPLRVELTRERELRDRLGIVEAALERVEILGSIEVGEAALGDLPDDMDLLTGNEAERLDELKAALDDAREKLRKAGEDSERAREEMEEAGFESEPPAEVDLETWQSRTRALAEAERDLRDAEVAVAAAGRVEESRRRSLGLPEGAELAGLTTAPKLDELSDFVGRAQDLAARREAVEARAALLKGASDAGDPEPLRRAADALRVWLGSSEPDAGGLPSLALWLLGAVAVLGLLLGLLVHPAWMLLSGLGLGALGATLYLRRGAGADHRAAARRRFEQIGVPGPAAWTDRHVSAALGELDRQVAVCERAQVDSQRLRELDDDLRKLAEEEEVLEARRAELRKQLGTPPNSDLALAEILRRLDACREAEAARAEAEGRAAQLSGTVASLSEGICEAVGLWTGGAPAGAERLDVLLNNLRSRVERWKRASLADSEAGRRREEAEKAIEDSSASLDRLFEGAGLEPGDERGLRDRLDRLDAYRERKAELKALEQQLKGLEARLAAEPELLGLDKDALEDLAGQARTAQERVDATRDEISEIEAEVRQARAAARREEALAEVAAARERLKEAFHLAMHRRAATLFLDRVEREHEQVARPDVLVRAQDWFKAFTHHRYELKVSGADPPAFRAFDNTAQRGLSLDELSDGTRVQLLLAARLAFATTAEPGESVPLFLDEPLTTSDPERFAAVAAALVALVGTGRQVFYLTSNPDDVARWHRACVRNGAEPPRVLDMEVIRGEAAEPPDPRALDLVVLPSVPAPAGMTPADYAEELRVPAPRPWDPVGALHLYFLLPDDLNLLFHVLSEAGVKTVGQWASFDRSGAATAVVSDAQNLALRARLRVCEATIHAARVGRGRPVDRRSLESSGAVSRSFIQKISALAEDLGGDAAALLEALSTRSDPRTKRFPRDKEVELKQWLEQREHLDERAPLHSSAAVARGLAAASEDVRGGRLTRSEVRRLAHTLFEALGTVDASAPRV